MYDPSAHLFANSARYSAPRPTSAVKDYNKVRGLFLHNISREEKKRCALNMVEVAAPRFQYFERPSGLKTQKIESNHLSIFLASPVTSPE